MYIRKSYSGSITRKLLPEAVDFAGTKGDNLSSRIIFSIPAQYADYKAYIRFDILLESEYGPYSPSYELEDNVFTIPIEISSYDKEVIPYRLEFRKEVGNEKEDIVEFSITNYLKFASTSDMEKNDYLTQDWFAKISKIVYKDSRFTLNENTDRPNIIFTSLDGVEHILPLEIPFLEGGKVPRRLLDDDYIIDLFYIRDDEELTTLEDANVGDFVINEVNGNVFLCIKSEVLGDWYRIHSPNPTFDSLKVTGEAEFESDIDIEGDVRIGGDLLVEGSIDAVIGITAQNNIEATGDLIAGNDLDVGGDGHIIGSLEVGGETRLRSGLDVDGDVQIGTELEKSDLSVNGGVVIGDDVSVEGEIYTSLDEDRVIVSDTEGKLDVSDVSKSEVNSLTGIQGNVQTQLDAKEEWDNKTDEWGEIPNDVKYPTEKLVRDTFDAIDERINDVDERDEGQDTRMDGIDTRMDGIDTRDEGQDARLDAIELKNTAQDTRMDGIDARDTAQESRMDDIDAVDVAQNLRMQGIDERIDGVDTVDEGQDARLDAIELKNTAQDTRMGGIDTRIDGVDARDTAQESRMTTIEAKDTAQDGRLTTIEAKNNTQDSRLDSIEGKDEEQDGRLTDIEEYDESQDTRMDGIDLRDDGQDSRISLIEAVDSGQDTRMDGIDERIDGVDAKDTAQDTRMATIEGVDEAQNTRMATIESKDTEQDGRLDAIESVDSSQDTRMDTMDTRMSTIEGVDEAQNTRMATIESKDTEQDGRLDAIESVDSSQDTRMDGIDSRIDGIDGDIGGIQGDITGLSTNKADDNAVVHLSGAESVGGIKTFTDGIKVGTTLSPKEAVINGTLNVEGNIVQQGESYVTHAEEIETESDFITMRKGAVAGLTTGKTSGFKFEKYNGTNDGELGIDSTGTVQVGNEGDLQPLLTRKVKGDMADDKPIVWNATAKRGETRDLVESDIPNIGMSKVTDLDTELGKKLDKSGGTITGAIFYPYPLDDDVKFGYSTKYGLGINSSQTFLRSDTAFLRLHKTHATSPHRATPSNDDIVVYKQLTDGLDTKASKHLIGTITGGTDNTSFTISHTLGKIPMFTSIRNTSTGKETEMNLTATTTNITIEVNNPIPNGTNYNIYALD